MDHDALARFLEEHPSIKHYNPTSPDFDDTAKAFVALYPQPPAIVRPQSAEDVAALVSHCVATNTPFAVRSGGHDLQGRSQVADALRIDMRDIAYVHVANDKKTARIGGGALCGGVLRALEKEGLMTSTAGVDTVGYVGWATLGGYGVVSPSFGMGIDQIVGAKMVNSEGKCVVADEDLLEGLRGGGGNFGIVTELTIKVYPLQEIQAGLIIYQATDNRVADTKSFFDKLNDLLSSTPVPDSLVVQPAFFSVPGGDVAITASFTWLGPYNDEARWWHESIESLSPVATSSVRTTTTREYTSELGDAMGHVGYPGKVQTASTRGLYLSGEAVDALAKHGSKMPRTSILMVTHVHHGYSARNTETPSLFRNREEHIVFEIFGLSRGLEGTEEGAAWANDFGREMRGVEGTLEGTYVPLTPGEIMDLEKIYGGKYGRLVELKRKFDPRNVFKNAIPRLEV